MAFARVDATVQVTRTFSLPLTMLAFKVQPRPALCSTPLDSADRDRVLAPSPSCELPSACPARLRPPVLPTSTTLSVRDSVPSSSPCPVADSGRWATASDGDELAEVGEVGGTGRPGPTAPCGARGVAGHFGGSGACGSLFEDWETSRRGVGGAR